MLNLENLTISEMEKPENRTRLEHVKHLEFIDGGFFVQSHLDMYLFPHLQSLQISHEARFFRRWLQFTREHRNIRKLNLSEIDSRDDVIDHLKGLPNLVEITLVYGSYYNYVNLKTITEITDSHPDLMKLEIRHSEIRSPNRGK